MTQNTLFQKRTKVELKESYGGFEVSNPDHIDFSDIKTGKIVRMGSEIVKKFPSYDEAKKSFEEEVKRDYNSEVVWLTSKFQDQRGEFWLNGIGIRYELKANWTSGMYHFDFYSLIDQKPNLLTSTGYQSNFPNNLDAYDSVKEYIIDYITQAVKENSKKNPCAEIKWAEEHQQEVSERTIKLKAIVLARIEARKSKSALHLKENKIA